MAYFVGPFVKLHQSILEKPFFNIIYRIYIHRTRNVNDVQERFLFPYENIGY